MRPVYERGAIGSMLVIPAIDIHDGKCVRLYQGDFAKVTEYSDDPVEVARRWDWLGAEMLHVVDLDGARAGRPVNLDIVRRISIDRALPIQLGGGLRTPKHIRAALEAGATRIILGTAACDDPDMLQELVRRFGERIIVSIDTHDGRVMTDGWLQSSAIAPEELAARVLEMGIETIVHTSVSRDGTLSGVDVDAISCLLSTGANVIAAGGVGRVQDIRRLKPLERRGLAGVIIGRALYTGAVRLPDALRAAGNRRIIPCLDTKDGRVVKGVAFTRLRDAGDPLELALAYEKEGADELVLLDISATEEGRRTAMDVVRRVSSALSIPLTVGGGIAGLDDIERVLDAGASKVGINTAAVRNPELVRSAADAFGRDRIVVAIDAAAAAPDESKWIVCTCGGKQRTQLDLVEWACTAERLGAGEILLTSIDRDGAADGYDLRQLRAVTQAVSIGVIASGGAGSPEHFRDAFEEGGADAALAASVFHFGLLRIGEVKQYLASEGVDVRL
jgi:cyclase